MKRKVGILICVLLLLSMTISAVTAQKVIKDNHKNVNILDNSPPSDPIVTGPRFVIWILKFNIRAVSTDPDGDKIRYRIKIGKDEALPWSPYLYDSGDEIKFEVRLGPGYSGKLIIGVQAKDEHDAESGWTNHTVTVIKTRSVNSPCYFSRLFPRLFNLFGL